MSYLRNRTGFLGLIFLLAAFVFLAEQAAFAKQLDGWKVLDSSLKEQVRAKLHRAGYTIDMKAPIILGANSNREIAYLRNGEKCELVVKEEIQKALGVPLWLRLSARDYPNVGVEIKQEKDSVYLIPERPDPRPLTWQEARRASNFYYDRHIYLSVWEGTLKLAYLKENPVFLYYAVGSLLSTRPFTNDGSWRTGFRFGSWGSIAVHNRMTTGGGGIRLPNGQEIILPRASEGVRGVSFNVNLGKAGFQWAAIKVPSKMDDSTIINDDSRVYFNAPPTVFWVQQAWDMAKGGQTLMLVRSGFWSKEVVSTQVNTSDRQVAIDGRFRKTSLYLSMTIQNHLMGFRGSFQFVDGALAAVIEKSITSTLGIAATGVYRMSNYPYETRHFWWISPTFRW